jgi:hypothetical protein
MEPHYRLEPPDWVMRIDSRTRRVLDPPPEVERWAGRQMWGYAGSGPNTTAATLLRDALGDRPLEIDLASICFTSDVLTHLEQSETHVITEAEVRAWTEKRMERGVEEMRASAGREVSEEEQKAMVRELLAQGPRTPWLEQYRAIHGAPDVT